MPLMTLSVRFGDRFVVIDQARHRQWSGWVSACTIRWRLFDLRLWCTIVGTVFQSYQAGHASDERSTSPCPSLIKDKQLKLRWV